MDSMTVTDCSEAQIIPLSKVLEMNDGVNRHLNIAVSSMITGVLPANAQCRLSLNKQP